MTDPGDPHPRVWDGHDETPAACWRMRDDGSWDWDTSQVLNRGDVFVACDQPKPKALYWCVSALPKCRAVDWPVREVTRNG